MGCSSSQAATVRRQPYKDYGDPDTTTSYVNDRGEPDGEEKNRSPMKDNQIGASPQKTTNASKGSIKYTAVAAEGSSESKQRSRDLKNATNV